MAADPGSDNLHAPIIAPLHVLHVVDRGVFARFGRMFRQLGLALEDEGVRVSLLTDDRGAAADLESTPVDCHWLPQLSGWRAWRLKGRLFLRYDPLPTLVHLWGASCLDSVGAWAREAELPHLVHVLSAEDLQLLLQRPLSTGVHLAAACTRFHAALRQRWPQRTAACPVLRPALIAPDTFGPPGSSGQTLGVLWCGRLTEGCGAHLLVEAIALLRDRGRDIQAILVGVGPAEGAVWRDIRARKVHDCVSLIDAPGLWDRALIGTDIQVVSAAQHQLSLAPLLAMAYGKLVLTSRDQLAEWFIEDRTTWQFTPGSAVELAYQITRVLDGDPAARRLAESASVYARRHHCMSGLAAQVLAGYRNILSAEQPPLTAPVQRSVLI